MAVAWVTATMCAGRRLWRRSDELDGPAACVRACRPFNLNLPILFPLSTIRTPSCGYTAPTAGAAQLGKYGNDGSRLCSIHGTRLPNTRGSVLSDSPVGASNVDILEVSVLDDNKGDQRGHLLSITCLYISPVLLTDTAASSRRLYFESWARISAACPSTYRLAVGIFRATSLRRRRYGATILFETLLLERRCRRGSLRCFRGNLSCSLPNCRQEVFAQVRLLLDAFVQQDHEDNKCQDNLKERSRLSRGRLGHRPPPCHCGARFVKE